MAEAATTFDLVIVNPDEVLYEGETHKLIVPGIKQDIAVLPDHTPLYAQLKSGEIQLVNSANKEQTLTIDGGILRVRHNKVSVIVGFETPETKLEDKKKK